MVARRLRLWFLAWVCVLAGGLVFGGVSGQAAVTHGYLSQITEVPASSGALLTGSMHNPFSLTVDSGHLWVAEQFNSAESNYRVDEFDAATGAFVSQLPQVPSLSFLAQGIAVSHTTGDLFVGGDESVGAGSQGRVAVFSAAGSLLSVWTGADAPGGAKAFGCFGCEVLGGVAVDNSVTSPASGAVYVTDAAAHMVDVFEKPEAGGKEPSKESIVQLTGTCPVEGTTCEPAEVIPFETPSNVTVDESTGDVLVVDGTSVVDVFEPQLLGGYVFVRQITGTPAGMFPRGGVHNVAVDGTSGEIFIAEGTNPGFVDQFSPSGVYLARITGENAPGGDLLDPASVAVDPGSHRVYVGDYRNNTSPPQPSVIDVFGPGVATPDVTTSPATRVTPYSATLNGTVKLDKAGEASCRFVWGTTKEFGQITPCSKPVTEEESLVEATLGEATGSKLEPDTTYYSRLQATNKNGLNPGEPRQDQEFLTPGPGIEQETVSNVTATSVTFDVQIDPNNAPTTSYFQYGASNAYGTNAPVAPGLSLGSGKGDVEAAPQHVQGLLAGTIYHYRVVALSELSPGHVEEFDGPDQTFTTQSSGGALEVPDGRSWELVTPPAKMGALFRPIHEGVIQASINGDAIADLAIQPSEAEARGYSVGGVSMLSTRGGLGWSSQVIATSHETGTGPAVGNGSEYKFFSEDLSLGVVQPFGSFTQLSPEESKPTADLRTNYLNGDVSALCQTSCYTPLVTSSNTPPGTVFGDEIAGECPFTHCGPEFVGGTPDLSHIILNGGRAEAQLTSTPTSGSSDLYEWNAGRLQFVSILPEGEGGKPAQDPGLGGYVDFRHRHAISDDGSRVIWEGSPGTTIHPHLYMRDMIKGETVRLDLPQGGLDKGVNPPKYMAANSDDSKIFFLDAERLTTGSSAVGDDLYEYDLNAPLGSRLTDLTVDTHARERSTSVLGASEDASYVYFKAYGVLAPGATHGECAGDSPCENLYVHHDGVTQWIASQSVEDSLTSNLYEMTARVSPNGRWFAFMSDRNLTGYDTHDAVSGHPDQEVYLYDASNGRLVCASCNPSGARPVGFENPFLLTLVDAKSAAHGWVAANVPPWTNFDLTHALYQSRYLSDSGRLFFNSNDALVPQDVNGTEDVYEYEPAGVPAGSRYECKAGSVRYGERSGGCVGLISSGTSPEESAFLDASATGGDVFFLTASKLVSQDFDTALDVYDAHECRAGSPCFAVAPVAPPVCSTGDSCKAAPSPQPAVFGSPSSATFSGAGNVTPAAPLPSIQPRSVTRAQKLTRALRACRKTHSHRQRSVCERQARKRYGAGKQSRKANATRKSGR